MTNLALTMGCTLVWTVGDILPSHRRWTHWVLLNETLLYLSYPVCMQKYLWFVYRLAHIYVNTVHTLWSSLCVVALFLHQTYKHFRLRAHAKTTHKRCQNYTQLPSVYVAKAAGPPLWGSCNSVWHNHICEHLQSLLSFTRRRISWRPTRSLALS